MKRLLPLFAFFMLSATLHAQTPNSKALQLQKDDAFRNYATNYAIKKRGRDTTTITPPQAYLVNPRPGVHRLPQDNMPCIVPDINATVAMPNVWRKTTVPFQSGKPRIPNPAKPFKLTPSRPLIVQPQQDQTTK